MTASRSAHRAGGFSRAGRWRFARMAATGWREPARSFPPARACRCRAGASASTRAGHWLALHSEDEAREWGASLEARLAPGAGGRGLSLAFGPQWGQQQREGRAHARAPVRRGARRRRAATPLPDGAHRLRLRHRRRPADAVCRMAPARPIRRHRPHLYHPRRPHRLPHPPNITTPTPASASASASDSDRRGGSNARPVLQALACFRAGGGCRVRRSERSAVW